MGEARTYIDCPECGSDQLYVQGRVSMPLYLDNEDGERWWDWTNAEMIDDTEYVCYDCDYIFDGVIDDIPMKQEN